MNITKFIGTLALAAIIVPTAAFAHDEVKTSPLRVPTAVEVAITSAGNVLVRGATVTAVSGSTITASTVWGPATLSWSVITDAATTFTNKVGATITLADIAVGDMVSFAGAFNSGSALSVKASAVKDWTRGGDQRSASGIVASISGNAFVLGNRGSGTTTVAVTSSTVFTLNGEPSSFAALTVGDSVKVTGTMNTSTSLFTASKVAIVKRITIDDKRWENIFKKWFNNRGFHFGQFKDKHND